MNICVRNCKYYEECIPFRYNNLRQSYMTEIEEGKTTDNLPVIYVTKCNKFKRFKGFNRAIGVGIRSARHSHKSKRWKEKRNYILKRDNYLCQECKKYGRRVDGDVVHHIIPIEEAPELAFVDDNLITICKTCHNKLHPEKGGRKY